MKFPFFKKIILIATLGYCLFSCSSDLDFNQAEDFNIQPVFTTNLAYFELKESGFFENGIEDGFFEHTSNVDFFSTPFVDDNLVKAEMNFRFKNAIPRDFVFSVDFQDVNDVSLYKISFNIPASTPLFIPPPVSFDVSNLYIIKNTKRMVFSLAMNQGPPPLSPNSQNTMEMSSSLTAYFDVK
jgi:hypothetical protein